MNKINWILNTSNEGKKREFERLFAACGSSLTTRKADLREVDADPMTVVVHKASQLEEGILVEDTSLDIEGAKVGVNVRWLLENLPDYVGRKAVWRVLLAYKKEGQVHVYQGMVHGSIVSSKGESAFGFDSVFLPRGAALTLAEAKPDAFSARAKAVDALFREDPIAVLPSIQNWTGAWQ